MTRNEQILREAPEHLEGKNFRIGSRLVDINGNGVHQNVTCLIWETGWIAIDLIWW